MGQKHYLKPAAAAAAALLDQERFTMLAQVGGIIWQQSVLDALLAALHTTPGGAAMLTPHAYLYTDNHAADPVNDDPTKFTEPAWAGYASVAISAFSGPVNTDNKDGRNLIADQVWICTGAGTGFSIVRGVYIADGANAVLYAQCPFITPVNITQIGDSVELDTLFQLLFRQGV